MKPYLLGIDNKSCIWPIPSECTWNGERYKVKELLKISGSQKFCNEMNLFVETLKNKYLYKAELTENNADVVITECSSSEISDEGYLLDITEESISLRASTECGVFYGLQTLLQLIEHSPDPSIHGAHIIDKPLKSFRGVHLRFPEQKNLNWVKGFIDFLAKYKINFLILEIEVGYKFEDWIHGIITYINERHIEIIPRLSVSTDLNYEFLQDIIRIFAPGKISIRVDRTNKLCAEKLANQINSLSTWLKHFGIDLMAESIKFYEDTGSERIIHKRFSFENDIIPSTYEAINLLSKDILIDDVSHGGFKADSESEDYFMKHGFKQVYGDCSGPLVNWEGRIRKASVLGAYVATKTEASNEGIGNIENKLYEIIKVSCILWWQGFKTDHTSAAYVLPEYLERTACKLYPAERDLLNGTQYPSYGSSKFKTINLRDFYNATLSRIKFRQDDYDLSFLEEAKSITSVLPFSILQGVKDFKSGSSFVISGNILNDRIQGIPIGLRAKSLVFLHTYLENKISKKNNGNSEADSDYLGYFVASDSDTTKLEISTDIVAYYIIHYEDGTKEKAAVQYGRDICYWKGNLTGNFRGHGANPVFVGVTLYKIPYTICSQEWINTKPELKIIKIDTEHTEGCKGEGIALLAITAVQ
jgi:hypothetical protein